MTCRSKSEYTVSRTMYLSRSLDALSLDLPFSSRDVIDDGSHSTSSQAILPNMAAIISLNFNWDMLTDTGYVACASQKDYDRDCGAVLERCSPWTHTMEAAPTLHKYACHCSNLHMGSQISYFETGSVTLRSPRMRSHRGKRSPIAHGM